MHLLIPYFDAARTEMSLQEACRIAQPGDYVTVLVAVIVPAALPVDVGAGEIWQRVCQVERRIAHTRAVAQCILPSDIHFRCVRVHARDYASTILAGIENYQPDCTLLTLPPGIRGAFAIRFGVIPAVIRNAPCAVRVITTDAKPVMDPPPTQRRSLDPLEAFAVVAINPTVTQRSVSSKPEGQHAL